MGFVAAASVTLLAAPLGLAASILLSSLGFVMQTVGLKDGHTVIVCTCAAVASISTGTRPASPEACGSGAPPPRPCTGRAGVLVGVLGLGESLPSTLPLKVVRLLAWGLILLGVSALASGQGAIPGHCWPPALGEGLARCQGLLQPAWGLL